MTTPSLRPIASLLLLLSFALLPSCRTYSDEDTSYVGSYSYPLAEIDLTNGGKETYRLHASTGSRPARLEVWNEADEDYVDFGVDLVELDKSRAQAQKPPVKAYTGLLVRNVTAKSAAETAGIRKGDILETVNGQETYYLKDFQNLIAKLKPDTPVPVRLHGAKDPVMVELQRRKRRGRTRLDIPLESPEETNPKAYAGVRLAQIPLEHSKRIYGDDRNAIVVSGVILGSPAYLAGLRAGDIITKVDDKPTPSLEELMRTLRIRGPAGETMQFEVAREKGRPFGANVALADYAGTTRVRIPFTFHSRSSARKSAWSAAWGILAAYENAYLPSESRLPEEAGSYSMLLGLFKYRWRPSGSSLRLLWFISFE